MHLWSLTTYIEFDCQDIRNSNILYNFANLLSDFGKQKDSLIYYNKALEITKTIPNIYFNKANALLDLKHYIEAIENYDKTILLKNNHRNAIFNKAIALSESTKISKVCP